MDDSLKDSWQPQGPVSKQIKERIQKAGKRFHANDNISEFIEKDELENSFHDDAKSINYIYPNLKKGSKSKLKYLETNG